MTAGRAFGHSFLENQLGNVTSSSSWQAAPFQGRSQCTCQASSLLCRWDTSPLLLSLSLNPPLVQSPVTPKGPFLKRRLQYKLNWNARSIDIHSWHPINHMQNSAPSWITGVRHLESSFASFATTRSRSNCTCTSIQILAKFVAWSCESLTFFLVRFAVTLFGWFASSLLCGW